MKIPLRAVNGSHMGPKILTLIHRSGDDCEAEHYIGRVKLAHVSGSWPFVRSIAQALSHKSSRIRNYNEARSFVRRVVSIVGGTVSDADDGVPHRLFTEEEPFGPHASGIRPKTDELD